MLTIDGEGSGPIEAFVTALGETLNEPVTILSYQEVGIGSGSDAQAVCIVAIEDKEEGERCYGLGSKSQHDNNRAQCNHFSHEPSLGSHLKVRPKV